MPLLGAAIAVIAPSHKHRHGTGFQINIWLKIPPHETVIVNHLPSDNSRYEYIEGAVEEAFSAARRQVDDLARQS